MFIMRICQSILIFFSFVREKHKHNTRLASRLTYSQPKIRTNYGKFNIRYVGPVMWNDIEKETKKLN